MQGAERQSDRIETGRQANAMPDAAPRGKLALESGHFFAEHKPAFAQDPAKGFLHLRGERGIHPVELFVFNHQSGYGSSM